jgi:hypothetical protein
MPEQPMNLIAHLRNSGNRLARAGGVLFVLVWLGLVVAPCVSAMHRELPAVADHDCPHCPPQPCHEVQDTDCDYSDLLDAPRAGESFQFQFAILPADILDMPAESGTTSVAPVHILPPARAGPRIHLLNAQFNE